MVPLEEFLMKQPVRQTPSAMGKEGFGREGCVYTQMKRKLCYLLMGTKCVLSYILVPQLLVLSDMFLQLSEKSSPDRIRCPYFCNFYQFLLKDNIIGSKRLGFTKEFTISCAMRKKFAQRLDDNSIAA